MAAFLKVTAPVAVIRDEVGAQHYFYEGAVLPKGLDGDHVKLLLDDGMLAEVSDEAAPVEDAAPAKRTAAKKSADS